MNDSQYSKMIKRRTHHQTSCLIIMVIGAGMVSGCVWFEESRQKFDLGVAGSRSPYADSAAYKNTIGSLTYYQGLNPMRVRGYGLVVGLGKNGSSDCPRPIFNRLVQNLYKQHTFSSPVVGVKNVSPEVMIEDRDTAVVIVQGEIPPAAVKGTMFDISVTALPGTQTKSLRGGRLYTTYLEMYRPISKTTSIRGRVLARANGPLFLNPFSQSDAATKTSELEGVIISGGIVTENRRIRLVLMEPSYRQVRQIEERINSFTSAGEKTADAISPSFIQLKIPSQYYNDTGHFLTLLRSLYLSRNPKFASIRTHQLAREIVYPTAQHGMIALCFEGLGRVSLPVLDDLYTHTKEYVSFHAAVAGLRLGDHIAGDAMIMHAENPTGQYRFKAIRALAETKGMAGAAMCLRRLLDDEDNRIQIAAYEALIKRGDPSIRSELLGGDNFYLDRIPTDRPNFVYVKRRDARRIALFGHDFQCSPPVLYQAPDGCVTLSANLGAKDITIMRVVVATGSSSPQISVSFSAPEWITLMGQEADVDYLGKVTGLGLDYGEVARALYHLCKSKSLNATFVLEQPNTTDLFGPPREKSRPESEL